tara:strand:+ start:487 stop:888 length:402 start_codon:yes stop_codon:yes gene_type:complete
MKKKGLLGFLALVILIIALSAWWFFSNYDLDIDKPVACTEEAKICPDGTAVGRVGENCEFEECPDYGEDTFCTEEQREVDGCIEIYQPVCGWSDPEKIQCITFPCASTYSNSCFACQDENVEYWTEGECPSPS